MEVVMTAEQMDAGADTTPAADEGRVLYPRKLRGRPVMAFASVTREQFEIRSEVGAVHIPTGADFRAYPYSNPDDMLQSLKVTWGRAACRARPLMPSKSEVWHRSC
jgi:hypothetical protein